MGFESLTTPPRTYATRHHICVLTGSVRQLSGYLLDDVLYQGDRTRTCTAILCYSSPKREGYHLPTYTLVRSLTESNCIPRLFRPVQ